MTPDPKELMPCPFCGSEADCESLASKINPEDVVHAVSCMGEDCPIGYKDHGKWATRKEAINAWNTRASHPREVEEVTVEEFMQMMVLGYEDAKWFMEKYPQGIKIKAGGEL